MVSETTKVDAKRRSLRSLGQYTIGGGVAVVVVAVLEALLGAFNTGEAVTVQQLVTVVVAVLVGAASSWIQRRMDGAKMDLE